jgi:hypothetical protein
MIRIRCEDLSEIEAGSVDLGVDELALATGGERVLAMVNTHHSHTSFLTEEGTLRLYRQRSCFEEDDKAERAGECMAERQSRSRALGPTLVNSL